MRSIRSFVQWWPTVAIVAATLDLIALGLALMSLLPGLEADGRFLFRVNAVAFAFASVYAWGWVFSNSPQVVADKTHRSVPLGKTTWLIRPTAHSDFNGPFFGFVVVYFALLPAIALRREVSHGPRKVLRPGDYYSLVAPGIRGEFLVAKIQKVSETEVLADILIRSQKRRRAIRAREFATEPSQLFLAPEEFIGQNPRFLWSGNPSFWSTRERNYPGRYPAIEEASERVETLEQIGEL